MMLVYLAGPITAKDGVTQAENIEAAAAIYYSLIKAGVNCFCPHLCGIHQLCDTVDYDRWLEYDLAILDHCTHVLMLPRWETSSGAVREHDFANGRGKTIVYDEKELVRLCLKPSP